MITPAKDQFQDNPSQEIERQIREFVRTSPAGRLEFMDGYAMWDEPLVRFADGDDPIFAEYKTIIAPEHLTPREALALACGKAPGELPERISVISWVLPITQATKMSNRSQSRIPSRLWSHTRWYGEILNDRLRAHVVDMLTKAGFLAAAPVLQSYFKLRSNEKGPYSTWSERHIAYAAGHGTFSLSDGFITERGIAHRCGSVVTSLVLPPSPRTVQGPYSNCLHYVGVSCTACMERCPAGAISEKGHDKFKCKKYLDDLGYVRGNAGKGYDNETSISGCGLCQTGVPCESTNPAARLRKTR